MTKTKLITTMVVLMAAGSAHAGGQAGSVGAGAEAQISGAGGASINFDQGDFHVGGFLGFADPDGGDNTVFTLGARFYYHVHSTTSSDFGLGGGLGLVSVPEPGMPDERDTAIFLEPSFQIRLFLASNVALSATTGVVIGLVDADGVAITGQSFGGASVVNGIGVTGGVGLHYYFF